ncbi:hypothetical protein [Cellulomonas aerilata]|nr:hypothetical protein [Cellulomonas aerilata]
MMTESYDNTRPPGTLPTSDELGDSTLPPSYPAGSGSYETGTYGTTTYTGAHVADDSGDTSKVDQAKEKAGEVKDQVKGEAQNVAQTAAAAGSRVADTAKEQAAQVTGEARRQAKDMLQQTKSQLTSQVGGGQQKLATAIRTVGTELSTMAGASDQPGVASDLVHQASGVVDSVASWFENKEPADVLGEVTTFARRRPGAFLLVAATAGLVAGRLARSLKDQATADQEAAQPSYVGGDYATTGYETAATGYTTDTGYAGDAYTTPTTSAYGTTTYGTPDVPGTTTGGYGGTA